MCENRRAICTIKLYIFVKVLLIRHEFRTLFWV